MVHLYQDNYEYIFQDGQHVSHQEYHKKQHMKFHDSWKSQEDKFLEFCAVFLLHGKGHSIKLQRKSKDNKREKIWNIFKIKEIMRRTAEEEKKKWQVEKKKGRIIKLKKEKHEESEKRKNITTFRSCTILKI